MNTEWRCEQVSETMFHVIAETPIGVLQGDLVIAPDMLSFARKVGQENEMLAGELLAVVEAMQMEMEEFGL